MSMWTKIWMSARSIHGNLTGLTNDDHSNYLYLPGRSGGQKIIGSLVATKGIVGLGAIENLIVKYNTTTAVIITAGYCEANGKYYEFISDQSHNLTSLAAGFDFHYIYIDDSASTPPTAVIIDSIAEPAYDAAKQGWYNGNDRCIGNIMSPAGGAIIDYFDVMANNNKHIQCGMQLNSFPTMASSMNPDQTWQIPDDNDGDVVTPVNAVKIRVMMTTQDSSAITWAQVASKEYADNSVEIERNMHFSAYNNQAVSFWFQLGISRQVRISGNSDDDNLMNLFCTGFGYER